ncbi:MAG: DDE-type integrase/transposase/recombinase [Oligoflexia bacterium]|nr:DDE-type integrase/transposase/recombinase [Oligoflexia bacterium]
MNIDNSEANKAGAEAYNVENDSDIEIRQCKYLNNVVEQDHRFIKKIIRPMLGFKNFFKAKIVLAGIEVVRMIKKRADELCQFSSKLRPKILFIGKLKLTRILKLGRFLIFKKLNRQNQSRAEIK